MGRAVEQDGTQAGSGRAWKRRGILAAAGAVVAGLVAQQTMQPVAATSGGGNQGFLALGSNPWYVAVLGPPNTPAISSAPTVIQASPNFGNFAGTFGADSVVFEADARASAGNIHGIIGYGTGTTGIGVSGQSMTGGVGVAGSGAIGVSGAGDPTGVQGSGTMTGVAGSGSPTGVFGNGHTTGVYGQIANGMANTVAVRGENQSTGTDGYGVYGTSANSHGVVGAVTTGEGTGVYGTSTNGIGVYGSTGTGLYGIVGASGSAVGSAGLLGVANGPNAVGFGTIAQGGATFAGYFNGTTVVNGTFAVTGGKAAAVKDAAGEYRLMYCVEAAEAWFEDVGVGKLVNGSTTVNLDPQFAQHIETQDYRVFLTPMEAACRGLAVTSVRADGFVVQELNGGASSGGFTWRVMAKRNDIRAERLAKFAMPPGLKAPETPALPAPVSSAPQPAPSARPVTGMTPTATATGAAGNSASSVPVQPAPMPRP